MIIALPSTLPKQAEFRAYSILLRMAAFGGFNPRATLPEFVRGLRNMRPEVQVGAWGSSGSWF